MRLAEVFVPGGLPSVTYVPRDSLRLERRVTDYLDEKLQILSVSGPTKSGKTVLLKRVVENATWVSGGGITNAEGFWTDVRDQLGVHSEETKTVERTAADSQQTTGSAELSVPGVARGGVERGLTIQDAEARSQMRTVSRGPMRAALDGLLSLDRPLVVDDFHYIPAKVQLEIVRALKAPVFEGLPVIFASVPHRAFDVVRVEKEMTGRVEHLQVSFWSGPELETIATRGFHALNVSASEEEIRRLAGEAFGSPHLMQDFCRQWCRDAEVRQAQTEPRRLPPPTSWDTFFEDRADNASKRAFDMLARGPRQRTDRKIRELKEGTTTDIYGAVLTAIAATGPRTELTYEELRTSLRNVLASEPPQRHEVTRVLEEITKIAREQIEGEPVVDYDEDLSTLYISDPFFAYYLRWAVRRSESDA